MSDPRSRRANPPQAIKKHPVGTLFVVHDPGWERVWSPPLPERDAKRTKNMIANRRISRVVTISPLPDDIHLREKVRRFVVYGDIGDGVVSEDTKAFLGHDCGPVPEDHPAYGNLDGIAIAPLAVAPEASGTTPAPSTTDVSTNAGTELGRKGGETSHETGGRTTAAPMLEIDGVASELASVSDADVGDLSELLGDGETLDDMVASAGGEDLPPLDGDSK